MQHFHTVTNVVVLKAIMVDIVSSPLCRHALPPGGPHQSVVRAIVQGTVVLMQSVTSQRDNVTARFVACTFRVKLYMKLLLETKFDKHKNQQINGIGDNIIEKIYPGQYSRTNKIAFVTGS